MGAAGGIFPMVSTFDRGWRITEKGVAARPITLDAAGNHDMMIRKKGEAVCMKKIMLVVLALVLTVSMGSTAFAWPDGNREGLLLGLTGGFANVEFESGSRSEDGTGFMAGALLGIGLNEQVLLSFKYRYYNVTPDVITYHTFTWCADLIFFPVQGNGLFLNGGLGRALVDPDAYGAQSKGGMILYAGVGYEIVKWFFLSIDYGRANLEDDMTGTTITISATLLGY
ncbi:MAG: hypothetical protein KBA61_06310 [Spirochaetes bacterium]|nr:hypothetical protein [Spirochaetota bacterium]